MALELYVSAVVAQFVLVVPLLSRLHDLENQLEIERISPMAVQYPTRLKHREKAV